MERSAGRPTCVSLPEAMEQEQRQQWPGLDGVGVSRESKVGFVNLVCRSTVVFAVRSLLGKSGVASGFLSARGASAGEKMPYSYTALDWFKSRSSLNESVKVNGTSSCSCLDKGLSVKEHISFIGKTAFCLELRPISTIGDFLTVDATCWLLGTFPC